MRHEFDKPRIARINEILRRPVPDIHPGDLHIAIITDNQNEVNRIVNLYPPGHLQSLQNELELVHNPQYWAEERRFIEKQIGWPLKGDGNHYLLEP